MRTAVAALAVLLALSPASADIVQLKSGGRIEGLARRDGDKVIIETLAGDTTVAAGDVVSIDEKHRSIVEDYYERAAALKDSAEPRAFLALALWARQNKGNRYVAPNMERAVALARESKDADALANVCALARDGGLGAEVRPLGERLLALDPNHEAARRALGFQRRDNQWLTEDEFQAAQGNVKFEGRWMSPAERELVLRERALKLDERARAIDAREKKVDAAERGVADAQAAVARAQRDVDDLRRRVDQERQALDAREARVRAQERVLNALLHCAACGCEYTGNHVCAKAWVFCSTCDGWFRLGHRCRK
jgi:hypothetical protein